MKNATLLFLVKKSEGKVTDVCLAMKKRGFGAGRWNGVGGKTASGESIEAAAIREAYEEIGIIPKNMAKMAELSFTFPHNHDWNQVVHTYFTEEWQGEPRESEEMAPRWFKISEIPFSKMWPDDIFWFPKTLTGNLIKARFVFGEKDVIQEQKVEVVKSL